MKNLIASSCIVLAVSSLASACGGDTSNSQTTLMASTSASSQVQAADYAVVVQQLYIAYFGRPADPAGLTNFENALLTANAPTNFQAFNATYATSPAIKALIDSFGTSAESARLYGTGTTADFVGAIYQNVLGRAPFAAGSTYWTIAIDSGALTKGNAALSIMAGALANTTAQGLIDAAAVNNKVTVGSNFTTALNTADQIESYKGQTAAATARTMLSTVSNTTETMAFQTTITAKLAVLAGAYLMTQVTTRYGELNAILNSSDSADVKLTKLTPYCSIDFSLHGKGCKAGMREVILQGPRSLDDVAAFDPTAIDQFDNTAIPTDQNLATVFNNDGARFAWLWKKAPDRKFYLAGDGGKMAFIRVVSGALDWGGPVQPYLYFDVRVNDDGQGNPIADSAVITGPGLADSITAQATKNTKSSVWTNATDPWWIIESSPLNSDMSSRFGPSNSYYNLLEVQDGVTAGTPYVITLKKAGTTIATYKQSLRVAPYQSDYVPHTNFDPSADGGSTLTMKNGVAAIFPKLGNIPTMSLGLGGIFAADAIIPPGHERVNTTVFVQSRSGATYYSYLFLETVWSLAAEPIAVPAQPNFSAIAQICVDLQTVDANGHLFMTERCSQ